MKLLDETSSGMGAVKAVDTCRLRSRKSFRVDQNAPALSTSVSAGQLFR